MMIEAIMVRTIRIGRLPCDSSTSMPVSIMPSPVRIRMPMTMPAQAQTAATSSPPIAPSIIAETNLRRLMRVCLRSAATSTTSTMVKKADFCAE